jgi:hypothetical protein
MFENRKVIVTLTTIPSRLNNTLYTIKSLLNQTIKPDEIVLSLPVESIREKSNGDPYTMNDQLIKFIKENNITVYRCSKDYGPATKIIGVLERQIPLNISKDLEPLIVTFDDDKLYYKGALEQLLNGWKRNKNCVICRKGSNLFYKQKNNINFFLEEVSKGNELNKDKEVLTLFGTGGVLYRSSYFDVDIFNYKKYYPDFPEDKFITVDDVFLSGYLGRKGILKIVPKFSKNKYDLYLLHRIIKEKLPKKFLYHLDPSSNNRKIKPLADINSGKKGMEHTLVCLKYFEKYLFTPLNI